MDHLLPSPNWRDELRGAFPALFPRKCPISCGRGWSGLLHTLCGELQRQTDQHSAPQVVIYEVKEKYGGLRVNTRGGAPVHDALTDFAELLSERMCEACGAPGIELTDSWGWVSTRCQAHRNNRIEE
jgi:hypothetical protein